LGSACAAVSSHDDLALQNSVVRTSSAKPLSEAPEPCSLELAVSSSDPSRPQTQLLPSIEISGEAPSVGSAFPVITAERTDGIFKHNCTTPYRCGVYN